MPAVAPRWLMRLAVLPIVVSMTVGVLMSVAVPIGAPLFLAMALLGVLLLAARALWQLVVLGLIAGVAQFYFGLQAFMQLFSVSGGLLLAFTVIAFVTLVARRERTPGGAR